MVARVKHVAYPQLHERMIQVCAHLARSFGTIHRLKLMKLAYLADRLALERLEHPISYDDYRKLKCGPAGYDLECGLYRADVSPAWRDAFIRDGQELKLVDPQHPNDLLSDEELAILDATVTTYGHKRAQELVDFVHDLPEWKRAQHRPRQAIEYEDILDAMGATNAKKRRILAAIAVKRAAAAVAHQPQH
jgi:uncharacterized phage-associated protein